MLVHPLGCMASYEIGSVRYMHAAVVSALQMNASRTVFSLEGHAEILQDTACQVRTACYSLGAKICIMLCIHGTHLYLP